MSTPLAIPLRDGFQNQTLERVLEDILVRFVVNAPPEDLSSHARILFLFEEAHWFYLDFVKNLNQYLPNLKLKNFAKKLIELFPLIWKGGDPDQALVEFSNYKSSIPVRGAALFNESLKKIVLVQGTESASWSFPRGKISKDEEDHACAIREVKEEIGFDITPYINTDEYIERTIGGKHYKIYLVRNIPEDTIFQPSARNEIAAIKWANFGNVVKDTRAGSNKYFLIKNMIQPMQNWIKKNRSEFSESQLKKEVEQRLKFMLGIGQDDKPAIDPGRELLDFIRKSTAEKQLKDEQNVDNNAANLQQQMQQIQQQQFLQQQQMQYPLPAFGFQPPSFQQLPTFISPFAPPHPQFINGLPAFPYPQFPGPLPSQFPPPFPSNNQFPPEQRAPSAEELSRPSQGLRQRNEEQSKELLSILNGGDSKRNNARELLSLFHKNKTGTGETPKKISLLKREEPEKSGDTTKDYSKNLLALLSKKGDDKKANTSNSKAVGEEKKKVPEQPAKPKIKLLKREENIEIKSQESPAPKKEVKQTKINSTNIQINTNETNSQRKESTNSYASDNQEFEAAPPSKELMELIKKSKGGDDFEMFEEFSDEEDYQFGEEEEEEVADFSESVKDEEESNYESDPSLLKGMDKELKNDPTIFDQQLDAAERSNDLLTNMAPSSPPNSYSPLPTRTEKQSQQPPPIAKASITPPKKFKLLKRGESLTSEDLDSKPDSEKKEAETERGVIDDNASGTSTIQFSDDDDEDDTQYYEDSRADHSDEEIDDRDGSETPIVKQEPIVDSQASNNLLSLLQKPKPTSEQTTPSITAESSPAPFKTLSDIENGSSDLNGASPNHKGSQELLSLLRGNGNATPKQSEYSTPNNDLSSSFVESIENQPPKENYNENAASNSLLSLLKRPKMNEVQETTENINNPVEKPSSPAHSSNAAGADLLSLLHGKKSPESASPPISQSSGGADLLNILHNNKSSPPIESQPTPTSTSTSGGADLLSLLHKNRSPEPTQPTFHHNVTAPGTPANDLLSLLHKNPSYEAPSQEEPKQEEEKPSSSSDSKGASFLDFLMRK